MNTSLIGGEIPVCFITHNKALSPGLLNDTENGRLEIKDLNSIFSSLHDCGPVIGECTKYLILLPLKLEG